MAGGPVFLRHPVEAFKVNVALEAETPMVGLLIYRERHFIQGTLFIHRLLYRGRHLWLPVAFLFSAVLSRF